MLNAVKSKGIKLVMSTDVRDFREQLKDFMDGSRIDLLCAFRSPDGNLVIHGAHDGISTLIEDILIEVED